jgi:hypothetical protein
MITESMKEYLQKIKGLTYEQIKKRGHVQHCVYLNRIQRRIDRELDFLLWLCIHKPEIFLNEKKLGKERLKKLLLAIKALNPNCDVMLVIENLNFPEEAEEHAD